MSRKPKKPAAKVERTKPAATHAMTRGKQEITVPLLNLGLENWPPPAGLGSRREIAARIAADLESLLSNDPTTSTPEEDCWIIGIDYHSCTLENGTVTVCRYEYYECDTGRTYVIVTPL